MKSQAALNSAVFSSKLNPSGSGPVKSSRIITVLIVFPSISFFLKILEKLDLGVPSRLQIYYVFVGTRKFHSPPFVSFRPAAAEAT